MKDEIATPCAWGHVDPIIWVRAGLPRNFNPHRYCQKVFIGHRLNGQLIKCSCDCHRTQLSLPSMRKD